MKILHITAGAGGMYCGSCLRDNALAAELKARGHAVVLLPVYTPPLTDEPNVSESKVLFGGVSVYLQQYVPLFRKTPWLLDRLWDSSFAIKTATRFSVSTDPGLLGELTISMLKAEEGVHRKELLKLLHWLKGQPTPDVINLPNSLLIGLAAPIRKALDRPVFCTLQGEDLFLEGLREPYKSAALKMIQEKVADVDAFVAVSDYYAEFMGDYLRIPAEKMYVVPLGINLDGYQARQRSREEPFTIGYFARVAPEKGLHNLVDAYRHLRLDKGLTGARLEVAGYLGPEHRSYLRGIERQMSAWGLDGELQYRGSLDRKGKVEFLQSLDVLSVPSDYKEPKGMYVLEAMACGVPVVQPRHGAFPEILEKTGGGILVDSGDAESVAEGIISIWKDPELAEELGGNGRDGVHEHYSVEQEALRTLEVYGNYTSEAGPRQEKREAQTQPAE
jgi:glycosyltransferase involved in cell wall biosynthesis